MLTHWRFSPFFNTDGGGAGAPAAPAAATPASSPASGGNPSAPAASATPASSTPAAGTPAAQPNAQPRQYTYAEDRSNWVPSHVVRQRSDELQKAQQELALWKSRTEALSGVKAPAAPNPEADAVKAEFFKIFPQFQKLEPLIDKLEKMAGVDFDGLVQNNQQVWIQHGTRTLNTLVEKFRAVYGGAELAPKAEERIQRAFVAELQDDAELRARYDRGDSTVVDDFVKDYTGTVLDPYRRSISATAPPANPSGLPQRRIPRGGGGSAVVPGQRPATLKPSDGEAFHKAAFASLTQRQ